MDSQTQADYWSDFWAEHSFKAESLDPHSQVFRTLNRKPIQQDRWNETVEHVLSQLPLKNSHSVLDLAGGNGLFAQEIASHVCKVTVVDFADGLLQQVTQTENMETICDDMRVVELPDESFDHVLLYAALQYLTLAEATRLFNPSLVETGWSMLHWRHSRCK